jgi:hypothetical protein
MSFYYIHWVTFHDDDFLDILTFCGFMAAQEEDGERIPVESVIKMRDGRPGSADVDY